MYILQRSCQARDLMCIQRREVKIQTKTGVKQEARNKY